MNTITVEFWQLVGGAFAAICALVPVLWALFKVMAKQFKTTLDVKFEADKRERAADFRSLESKLEAAERSRREGQAHWDKRFNEQDTSINEVREQVNALTRELPDRYQRREDAIRGEAILHAKLDALGTKLDALIMGRLHERN